MEAAVTQVCPEDYKPVKPHYGAAALVALYARRLGGGWRAIYVITAMIALYLNVFVLVAQSFQKVTILQPYAPTGSEPPFLIAQAATLIAFVLLGAMALKRFRPI